MAKGISTQGDVLVNMTADGVDLNQIWAEMQDVLEMYNTERSAVVQLLTYPTTLGGRCCTAEHFVGQLGGSHRVWCAPCGAAPERRAEARLPIQRLRHPPSGHVEIPASRDRRAGAGPSDPVPRGRQQARDRYHPAPIVHADNRTQRLAAYLLSGFGQTTEWSRRRISARPSTVRIRTT